MLYPTLIKVTWKSKLKAAFPDPNNYSSFMGNFSTATGIVTLLMMLGGRLIFKKFGWGVAAMITPITLLTTGERVRHPDRESEGGGGGLREMKGKLRESEADPKGDRWTDRQTDRMKWCSREN